MGNLKKKNCIFTNFVVSTKKIQEFKNTKIWCLSILKNLRNSE